ncbi:40S ribosomal protein S6 [Pteropus alecto]|uniref:40S ribosomal protein S6 n=1 Tax=Pteropus alecto TaxID=9402 RepID=L5KB69_PTEAL|nr:40S ribosomal protein S6 [Pteropus alecto]
MKLNISFPTTGCQKLNKVDDEQKLRTIYGPQKLLLMLWVKNGRVMWFESVSPDDFLPLGPEPLFRALACFLGLRPAGRSLVSHKFLASPVCLQLVDAFYENALVFEHVTLNFQAQTVILVAVNLRLMLSSAQSVKNSHPPHLRHSSTDSALSLTYAHMPALSAGQGVFPASCSGMDSHRLPDDHPICDRLPNLLTRVGTGDFIGFAGVQPDLLFATAQTLEASLSSSLSIPMAVTPAAKGKLMRFQK